MVVIPAGKLHWHSVTDYTYFEHTYVVPLSISSPVTKNVPLPRNFFPYTK
jgi:hypothetical protein